MSGRLDKAQLETLIASGEIDTVVAAFTDMQGRLVGKRATGRFFLDAVHEEWHACNYLLTVDMEMEPVPGFKAASWEKGYGDFVVKPDLGTLRRIPWLPGTALVLGDVCDHHGNELPFGPRTMLKRQLQRLEAARLRRQDGLRARVLRLRRQLSGRPREGLPRPQDRRLVHRGLPRLRDHQARAADARDPQPHGSRRHPGPGEQGRVGARPGGAQPGLCRGARDGRPARDLQERRQGDRLAAGSGRELHAQMAGRPRRQFLPHPRLALGRGRPAGLQRRQGRDRAVPAVPGRPARGRRRDDLLPGPLRQFLQALRRRLVRAHQPGLEPRQPHERLPGAGSWARARGSNAGSAVPT